MSYRSPVKEDDGNSEGDYYSSQYYSDDDDEEQAPKSAQAAKSTTTKSAQKSESAKRSTPKKVASVKSTGKTSKRVDAEEEQPSKPKRTTTRAVKNVTSKEETMQAKPIAGPKSRLERKLEYLQACANGDKSVYKEGSKRKKGYRQWCDEQYAPGYDGQTFSLKDKTVSGRKLFQSTIVKEAYKSVQNEPALKGASGNSLRLKIISAAMKTFEPVYKSEHFQNQIQNQRDANAIVKDFSKELQKQLKKLSK